MRQDLPVRVLLGWMSVAIALTEHIFEYTKWLFVYESDTQKPMLPTMRKKFFAFEKISAYMRAKL